MALSPLYGLLEADTKTVSTRTGREMMTATVATMLAGGFQIEARFDRVTNVTHIVVRRVAWLGKGRDETIAEFHFKGSMLTDAGGNPIREEKAP
jgi:hypothetical protein